MKIENQNEKKQAWLCSQDKRATIANEHTHFLERTLDLANQAAKEGNHPFGALLVIQGRNELEAKNSVNTDNDITKHAELNLVSLASRKYSNKVLRDSILYTSTEPCAMCCGAIFWSGIRHVVFSCRAKTLASIKNGSFAPASTQIFAFAKEAVKVEGPFLEEQSADIHRTCW